MPKRTEIRIAGLGGQGVVSAGYILGKAAVYDGLQAVQTQSYGAEARGSAAKSEVIISDRKIGFPVVRRSDVLVALSQPALDKHLKDLKDDGILILEAEIDDSAVSKTRLAKTNVYRVAATKTVEVELKSKLYANTVLLGALTKITGLVTPNALEKAIRDSFSTEVVEKNIKALRIGLAFADR